MSVPRRIVRSVRRRFFPGSARYWDRRYTRGGTSGPGSYGDFASFKAEFLNNFVASRHIKSVVEFGCGDGNQLALADYPGYLGLDVSPDAIARCRARFDGDETKRFALYHPGSYQPVTAELGLSLDVVLHLIEEETFHRHLAHLFASAARNVIIYGPDVDVPRSETAAHVRYRSFTRVIAGSFPGWALESVTTGIEPANDRDLRADFHVYGPA